MLIQTIPLLMMAGMMNGSFVVPVRFIQKFSPEMIWVGHSVIGLLLLPWLLLLLLSPQEIFLYSALETPLLFFLLFSGTLFGLGQVCFAYAIEKIGIGLSFIINIGIGLTIGSLFGVMYNSALLTSQGSMVLMAILLILSSLLFRYHSEQKGTPPSSFTQSKKTYYQGWILSSLAGITSGLQNVAFLIVTHRTQAHFSPDNSFWVWPPFLAAASIPMILGFLWRRKERKREPSLYILLSFLQSFRNFCLMTGMGICFTGSLALYSVAMSQSIGNQKIIGWPIFLVCIIFSSQLWGAIEKRTHSKSSYQGDSKVKVIASMLLLLAAIVLLTFAK